MLSQTSRNSSNIAVATLACGWIFTAVAVLVVGLLVSSRKIAGRRLDISDYLVLIAMVIALALVAETTWAIFREGFGQQVADVPKKEQALTVKAGAF